MRMRLRLGEVRDEFGLFIAQFPFEWFATLTFAYPVNQEAARKRITQWIRAICILEQLQIASIGVFNKLNRSHLHLVMLGSNRLGRTLSDVSIEMWTKRWGDDALIKPINNLSGVAGYLSRNLTLNHPDKSEIFIFNKKLLKRVKRGSAPAHLMRIS